MADRASWKRNGKPTVGCGGASLAQTRAGNETSVGAAMPSARHTVRCAVGAACLCVCVRVCICTYRGQVCFGYKLSRLGSLFPGTSWRVMTETLAQDDQSLWLRFCVVLLLKRRVQGRCNQGKFTRGRCRQGDVRHGHVVMAVQSRRCRQGRMQSASRPRLPCSPRLNGRSWSRQSTWTRDQRLAGL